MVIKDSNEDNSNENHNSNNDNVKEENNIAIREPPTYAYIALDAEYEKYMFAVSAEKAPVCNRGIERGELPSSGMVFYRHCIYDIDKGTFHGVFHDGVIVNILLLINSRCLSALQLISLGGKAYMTLKFAVVFCHLEGKL